MPNATFMLPRTALTLLALVAASVPMGIALGSYATGEGPVGLIDRADDETVLAPPETQYAGASDVRYAMQFETASAPIVCTGCGPGIAARRAMAEQRAYERAAGIDHGTPASYVPTERPEHYAIDRPGEVRVHRGAESVAVPPQAMPAAPEAMATGAVAEAPAVQAPVYEPPEVAPAVDF